MGSKTFRIFNRDWEGTSGIDVTVLDTTTIPLKELIRFLTARVGAALWLVPYRGIPDKPGISAFDVVLLDQNYRVLEVIAPYPQPDIAPMKVEPSSALILPLQSRSVLPMRAGNHLECQAIKGT